MFITPVSNRAPNYSKNSPNFKADFVFTKTTARAFKREMRALAYEQPLKTLRGKNPLQLLVKQIKSMHPDKKIKLYYEPSKHIGSSYITHRPMYTPARWVADSGTKKIVDAGSHMSEFDYPSKNPIQNLFSDIVRLSETFFAE